MFQRHKTTTSIFAYINLWHILEILVVQMPIGGGGWGVRRIPPQGGPQADMEETLERTVWCMGLSLARGRLDK